MLTISKNPEHIVHIDVLDWTELHAMWPPNKEVLSEIPTVDLPCFEDLTCVQSSFEQAACYIIRAQLNERTQPVGFAAISGVNRHNEHEPNIDIYLLDPRAQTAAFYAQLGLCGMLFAHPDVHAIESIVSTTSPQVQRIKNLGFTKMLTMETNVPRGPEGKKSLDSQWILQDPSVLKENPDGITAHDQKFLEGWRVYQKELASVNIAQFKPFDPFFTIQ